MTNRCEYCGLIVRIGSPHRVLKYFYSSKIDAYGARMAADRYLKSKGLSLTGSIEKAEFFYLPFYRFRGMALDYLAPSTEIIETSDGMPMPVKTKFKLKGKDFDVTTPAFSSDEFGITSLGIRPQAAALYAFSREEIPSEAIVVGSDITAAHAERQAMDLHRHNIGLYNKSEAVCSAMIGEKISVIYFPIWAITHKTDGEYKTVLVDSLAKRGYAKIDKPFEYTGKKSIEQNSQFIKPLKHQCPNCGADLEEKRFSLFYQCVNCDRAYLITDDGYSQIQCQAAEELLCAPYWRFPLEFKHKTRYKTVRDFSKLLTAEIALLRKEKQENRFYLYSPAFKAADVVRWAKKAISILKTQPHAKLKNKPPAKGLDFYIDEPEAKEMAVFLWQMSAVKYARLQGPDFRFTESDMPAGEIVWLPIKDYQLLDMASRFKEVNIQQ